MTGRKRQKPAEKKGSLERYSPEILYQFWAAAGGNVAAAQRLAADAGEDRVPMKPHTWAEYAEAHGFAERLKEEERKRWERHHAEREEQEERVLDSLAETFENLSGAFCQTIMRDVAALHGDDLQALRQAEKRLSKLFGSIEAIDRFFRIYLRSRGLPEHLSQQTMNLTGNAVSYEELEAEDTFAKSVEEARKKVKKT